MKFFATKCRENLLQRKLSDVILKLNNVQLRHSVAPTLSAKIAKKRPPPPITFLNWNDTRRTCFIITLFLHWHHYTCRRIVSFPLSHIKLFPSPRYCIICSFNCCPITAPFVNAISSLRGSVTFTVIKRKLRSALLPISAPPPPHPFLAEIFNKRLGTYLWKCGKPLTCRYFCLLPYVPSLLVIL